MKEGEIDEDTVGWDDEADPEEEHDRSEENGNPEYENNEKKTKIEEKKDEPLKNSESALNSGNNIRNSSVIPIIRKPVQDEQQQEKQTALHKFVNISEWLARMGWSRNPFNFTIEPSLFVGYAEQKNILLRAVQEGHKLILISGPTGSGKTTLLKWAKENINDRSKIIFLGKPPDVPERFIDIMNDTFKAPWFLRPFVPHIKNMYQIPEFLNKKLGKRQLVILCDEIHESDIKVLEWMRVLSDHIDDVSVVLSGLPVFESYMNSLETFKKRIIERIELLSLTKEETAALISTRIKNAGGKGDEFVDILDVIYERTQGFPREVLRYCNDVLDEAVRRNETKITAEMLAFGIKKEAPRTAVTENLTPMQRKVLELLKVPMTPGGLADMLDLGKYKSRQHAVRSVNNILKMMMESGYVERTKDDKAYVYSLSPRVKTLFVKS